VWVTGLTADGLPDRTQHEVTGRYIGAPCIESCLSVELDIDAQQGLLRLPIATGHVLDDENVRLDDDLLPVVAVSTGQPAVWLDGPQRGLLRYQSSPGTSPATPGESLWPPLPPEFVDFPGNLRGVSPASLALDMTLFVAQRVVYDTSQETVARHRQARKESITLFDRAAAIGAGDCDVQNSLVAAMLDDAGVQSRLAVGWLGTGGRAVSGLHAWAEYRGEDGRWRAVDASAVEVADHQVSGSTSPVAADSRRPWVRLPLWVVLTVLGALAVAIPTAVLGARRWRRSVRVGKAEDVVGLVRGAATRPHAYAGVHSLFTRRLLPLLSDRSMSLSQARTRAKLGRLACGTRRSALARRAARGGGTVLDLERPECAVVADALAAVDLHRWQEMLDRAGSDQLTTRVEVRLKAAGEPCHLVVASGVGVELAVLDGAEFGLGADARWVVIDDDSQLRQSAAEVARRWPARAALLLADHVVHRMGAPPAVRQRCLSGLASEAILEAAGGIRDD
jgi:transglutaminase-like putative cysteine protease